MTENRVFIDSDITIDLLAKRDHYASAAALFDLVETKQVKGHTTPVVLANIEYIISKYSTKSKARKALRMLLKHVSVLPMDQDTAQKAVESEFPDFEDVMQYYAAERGEIDVIITRNVKDYEKGTIRVMNAEEFMDLYGSVTD